MPSPLYTRPFVNHSSETIPAFAVFEVGGWIDNAGGVSVFKAVKPTKDGKTYYVNGPTPVAPNRKGWAASADGHWVLCSGSPQLNQEYGPKAGSWSLSADGKGGFIIVGDAVNGRIRAIEQVKGEVINRVQGTVASTVSETTLQFLINRLIILSGVDPRNDPNSPIEAIVVQNNLQKAYVNGVDRVIATQSKSNGLWYVETVTAAANPLVPFELVENKRYSDTAKLARLLDQNGVADTDAANHVYVVDRQHQFYGRAPETSREGYKGLAIKFTENYQNDRPGYLIATMEGPASFLIVTLSADVVAGTPTACVFAESPAVFGLPYSGRVPASSSVLAYNDIGEGAGAKSAQKWILKWNETAERYFLWRRVAANPCTLRRFKATSTIPAATGMAATAWGLGTAQFYNEAGVAVGLSTAQIRNPFWDSFLNSSVGWADISYTPPAVVSVGCTVGG